MVIKRPAGRKAMQDARIVEGFGTRVLTGQDNGGMVKTGEGSGPSNLSFPKAGMIANKLGKITIKGGGG